jgi:hypothetical protein
MARQIRYGAHRGLLVEKSVRGGLAPDSRLEAHAPPVKVSPLAAEASLYRHVGAKEQPLTTGALVAPGDRLSLRLKPNEPMYVTVLNVDAEGNSYVLFPIPGARPLNPLSRAQLWLPGRMGDSLAFWTVTSRGGAEGIIAVGSRAPLPELESVIAQVPRAAPGRSIQYAPAKPRAESPRSIGGVVREKATADRSREIEDALRALAERERESGDVWVWRIALKSAEP